MIFFEKSVSKIPNLLAVTFWTRVAISRKKLFHGTDGYFDSLRRNSVCFADRKLLRISFQANFQKTKMSEFFSKPFYRRERKKNPVPNYFVKCKKNSELRNFVQNPFRGR